MAIRTGSVSCFQLNSRKFTHLLRKLKWPHGFECECGNKKAAYLPTRKVYACSKCRTQHSVLTGTIFENTKKPLSVWFKAIYWVATTPGPVTAIGLQGVLRECSYPTAHAWLTKIQEAIKGAKECKSIWWRRLMTAIRRVSAKRPTARWGTSGRDVLLKTMVKFGDGLSAGQQASVRRLVGWTDRSNLAHASPGGCPGWVQLHIFKLQLQCHASSQHTRRMLAAVLACSSFLEIDHA